jgi:uncharacterized cupin superfamily protein
MDSLQLAGKSLVTRGELEALAEARLSHPWNPNSEIFLKRLSPLAGLRRLSLCIARVPPGKESFLYHRHERDEEFLLILSGRGRAEIGPDVLEVGAGDFMGFPAPDGPPQHLTNPFGEDLVYLMGGECSGFDIGCFPRLGRRMVFSPSGIWSVSDAECEQMTFAQWQALRSEPPASSGDGA